MQYCEFRWCVRRICAGVPASCQLDFGPRLGCLECGPRPRGRTDGTRREPLMPPFPARCQPTPIAPKGVPGLKGREDSFALHLRSPFLQFLGITEHPAARPQAHPRLSSAPMEAIVEPIISLM